MAKFIAIAEADIVGSMESLPFPQADPLFGSPNAFSLAFPPFDSYFLFNTDGSFDPTAEIASFARLTSPVPLVLGAGPVDHVWKAGSGDSYLFGTTGTPSEDTFAGLVLTAKAGDPTKTHGTEQQVNQFFFKFEDKIRGSEDDDKLCGWAEDDSMWGDEGDDAILLWRGDGKRPNPGF